MTIYLIEGESGEYENIYTWVSQAFTDKKLAQSTMDKWQQYATDNFDDRFDNDVINNSPDPCFTVDYTGTKYRLIEIELITDAFMEAVLTNKGIS